jgi:hypothetical protein
MPAIADPFLVVITQTIVDRFAPERVVLFGGRARETISRCHDDGYFAPLHPGMRKAPMRVE